MLPLLKQIVQYKMARFSCFSFRLACFALALMIPLTFVLLSLCLCVCVSKWRCVYVSVCLHTLCHSFSVSDQLSLFSFLNGHVLSHLVPLFSHLCIIYFSGPLFCVHPIVVLRRWRTGSSFWQHLNPEGKGRDSPCHLGTPFLYVRCSRFC